MVRWYTICCTSFKLLITRHLNASFFEYNFKNASLTMAYLKKYSQHDVPFLIRSLAAGPRIDTIMAKSKWFLINDAPHRYYVKLFIKRPKLGGELNKVVSKYKRRIWTSHWQVRACASRFFCHCLYHLFFMFFFLQNQFYN